MKRYVVACEHEYSGISTARIEFEMVRFNIFWFVNTKSYSGEKRSIAFAAFYFEHLHIELKSSMEMCLIDHRLRSERVQNERERHLYVIANASLAFHSHEIINLLNHCDSDCSLDNYFPQNLLNYF